jgi:hypothetical protein
MLNAKITMGQAKDRKYLCAITADLKNERKESGCQRGRERERERERENESCLRGKIGR